MKTLVTVYDSDLKNMIFKHGAIEKLKEFSEVDFVEEGKCYSIDKLARDIKAYDACITGWCSPKFTPEVLAQADNLKFIGHTAGTVVPIVDESIFQKDIVVVNANSTLAKSTAEAAMALIMAGAWNLHGYNTSLKQGNWSRNISETVMGLQNQVIGLIGYGDISKEVIKLLKPFNANILLYSHYCPEEEAAQAGVELCSLEELLKRSRIISLHNTLTPSTIGMIGSRELALVQEGALIVNTARGPIIDEQALLKALKTGRIFAALDVYEKEPLDKEHELLKLPNVLCLPHIGGFSSYWKTRLGITVIEDLERFVKGEELLGRITFEKFKRLTPS
jgi:phosphoglycerate dehydrogenase-like enzyme